ncbi:helix-turn-helix domain-containing protein [Cohnella fermenti]|nr:helix-turn-helix domain-containing protein [Cohnella fermenti]
MAKRQHIRVPYVLLTLTIPSEAKRVYLALLHSRDGTNKQIRVKIQKIAERAGLKERQVKKHIRTLCDSNMLSRKQIIHGKDAWGSNEYTIKCDETYYAAIPYEIAFDLKLSALELMTYCALKRHTDLNKQDFTCWMDKNKLAEEVGCSTNHIDKLKRGLRRAGYIDYVRDDSQITLIHERQLEN